MNTKDWILEKTLELILDKCTIDISINDIRNATGLTTGGIYYYYSDKNEIIDTILQKYVIDYIKIDFDKIILKGSSKDKIHDTLFYFLHHFINGVKIESINEKINYRDVLLLLTPIAFSNDEYYSAITQIGENIEIFLTDLVEDGKMQNEIRKDFSTKNIVESFYILYLGVQNYWISFTTDDINLIFEKNFELTWQAIKSQ